MLAFKHFELNIVGETIQAYSMVPEEITATVVIVHGMMEHGHRYLEVANYFVKHNVAVLVADLPGHGETGSASKSLGHWTHSDWELSLSTIRVLIAEATQIGQNSPVFLLGHSMGSFLAMQEGYTNEAVKGIILTGMTRPSKLTVQMGRLLASVIDLLKTKVSKRWAKRGSGLCHKLTFAKADKAYKSPYDWLTKDKNKVNEYKSDPLCGKRCSASFYHTLFEGILSTYKMTVSNKCDTYILSSLKDPMGEYGKHPRQWKDWLEKKWHINVSFDVVEGRHELLNEINRETIYNKCLNWMNFK